MRLPRRRRKRLRDHIDVLAKTARMEMDLGMGSWQDTIMQMNALIDQLDASAREARSEQELLLEQLRRHVSQLQIVIHKRESEYDTLQERFCALTEQANQVKPSQPSTST